MLQSKKNDGTTVLSQAAASGSGDAFQAVLAALCQGLEKHEVRHPNPAMHDELTTNRSSVWMANNARRRMLYRFQR